MDRGRSRALRHRARGAGPGVRHAGPPAARRSHAPKSEGGRKKHLNRRSVARISRSPNSHVPVAACWSVGIRTRGRTAARGLEDGWRGRISLKSRLPGLDRAPHPDTDRQPEAKPANPESPRGTQLKATTERAFLVSSAFHRPTPKRLVLHCRPCGVFPKRTVFRVRTFRPLSMASPQRRAIATIHPAIHRIGAACAGGNASHDRPYP
jgi:hypothetical protein